MSDEYTPAPKHKPRESKPAALLWELTKGQEWYRCELRDHEDWGCEPQIFTGNRNLDPDDHFVHGQHYPIREMALSEANRLLSVYRDLGYGRLSNPTSGTRDSEP